MSVESKFADITIAICSEFRSKKDYKLVEKNVIEDAKSKERIEIVDKPKLGEQPIEKITQDDLEKSIRKDTKSSVTEVHEEKIVSSKKIKPNIVYDSEQIPVELTPSEFYNLTDKPGSNLLVLRNLYQPYFRRGVIISCILHVIFVLIVWAALSKNETNGNQQGNDRIVIVEDIETPKFDPPDVDKQKEDELKENVKDNNVTIRPKITPKYIQPKIKRPKDNTDTTNISAIDSTKISKTDTIKIIGKTSDTLRLQLPDSLKSIYSENAIGMSLWFPKNWKLIDNRTVNLNQEQFNGVIINTDSLSEDPGAVSIFVQIDDSQHSYFNKSTFKNPFQMDDTTATGFSTEPSVTGGKRLAYKFFIFSDQNGKKKNIYVNTETKKDLFEKYKQYIDAIVRSIKIVDQPPKSNNP